MSIQLGMTGQENVINPELCKKLKFDHINKYYMHKPVSILENEMHKILWYFEIKNDYINGSTGRVIIKNKTCRLVKFDVLVNQRIKNKSKKRDIYLNVARKQGTLWNMNMILIPVVIGALRTVPKS